MHSFPKTPPLTPSPLPRARVAHPCKSPSSGNRSRAVPPLVQFARTRQCPAFSPTRLSLRADPNPSFSIFPNAPALRPRSVAAPPPSAASTQNPPSFHLARRACLSPLRHVCGNTQFRRHAQQFLVDFLREQTNQPLFVLHASQNFFPRRTFLLRPVFHLAGFLKNLPGYFEQAVGRKHSWFRHRILFASLGKLH